MPKDEDRDAVFSRLLEVTYSSTADPALYDDLVQVWENYMARTPDLDRQGPHLTHFNRALGIFAAMGRRRRKHGRDEQLVASFTTPAFLCSRDMTLRHMNAAARALLDGGEADPLRQPDLARAVRTLTATRRTDIVPLPDGEGRLTDCAVISLQDGTGEDGAETGDPACLVVLTKPGQADSPAWTRLSERFELSAAEAGVLHGLVGGQTPDRIAAARGVSVNTVRTQIRRLLEKTGAASLADLVRQTLLICTQLETVALATRLGGRDDGGADDDLHSILTSDGRLLSFREMGDPQGRPLLFLHNMMGGTALPPHIQRLARDTGWRIIAPSRPGFGASDSVSLSGMALVERTARDCRELLDHLGIDAALVLGLMSSAGIAVTFAHMYPRRCAGLLNVAHGAVMDDRMIALMPNPTRTMAQTYLRSALALRFLTRVAVASIDVRGPQHMMRRILGLCPADARLADDPQILQSLGTMLQHTIVQGGEAFSKDGFVSLHDFSDTIRALDPAIPALVLLGAEDAIYRPDQARRLLPDLAAYPVEVLPDAGQYLFYSHTRTVLERATGLWQRGARRRAKNRPARLRNHQS